MSILKKINLKSFFSYKLWLFILCFVLIQTTLSQDMSTIKARKPDFKYNNPEQFIDSLNDCIFWIEKDLNKYQKVPHEIIIATAIIESDYGTSRFAINGNNLFGIRTYDLSIPHIKPFDNPDSDFGVKKYETKCDSVKDYIHTLNSSFAFEEFRELRFKMIKQGNFIDVFKLVEKLKKYASNPNYVNLLKKTIKSLKAEIIYGEKELKELNESYKQSLQNKKERDEKK